MPPARISTLAATATTTPGYAPPAAAHPSETPLPEPTPLEHVDTLLLPVTASFNFRYTLWKPSHFATGLEQRSPDTSWRTFRVGERLTGAARHHQFRFAFLLHQRSDERVCAP